MIYADIYIYVISISISDGYYTVLYRLGSARPLIAIPVGTAAI